MAIEDGRASGGGAAERGPGRVEAALARIPWWVGFLVLIAVLATLGLVIATLASG
jgi:hypothetical protein